MTLLNYVIITGDSTRESPPAAVVLPCEPRSSIAPLSQQIQTHLVTMAGQNALEQLRW